MTAETSQTLDRGLRVLKLLADTDHGLTVTELSNKLGVNRTVVYRLLATLEQHALVRRDLGGRARVGLGVLRLGRQVHPLVREAALPALRKRLGAESDAVFAAALGRKSPGTPSSRMARPYQVIRVAANELKGAQSTPQLVAALADALQRVSADQCDTSRDVRLALIEARKIAGGSGVSCC